MTGLILPPGASNGSPFANPWEQPTPVGTGLVLSSLPKELIDYLVQRIADEVMRRMELDPA